MFTTTLMEFNLRRKELHRQAEFYRLAKSLEKPNPIHYRMTTLLGKLLIQSGQQLINRVQTAH